MNEKSLLIQFMGDTPASRIIDSIAEGDSPALWKDRAIHLKHRKWARAGIT